jgi:hypothetical protein
MLVFGFGACKKTEPPADSGAPNQESDADADADADVDVDDTGEADCFGRTPSVEIGTGETTFEALEEGASVVMVHGPQGGWHMLGSVRTHNMEPIIDVHYTITDEDSGVRISDNTYRVAVVNDGDCTGYYPGMYGYLEVSDLHTPEATRPPELLGYKTVVMTMEVTDYGDRTASTSLRVTAEPDPIDLESDEGDGE